ncbi:hypothetical protein T01_4075, partial [Trichinella spiralis]
LNFQIALSLLVEFNGAFLLFIFQRGLGSPQRCLIISKGAFVCLIYVAIGSSIVERSLSSLRALSSCRKRMEQRKCENTDDTKQNNRKQEICEAGLRILRKGELRLRKTSSLEQHQRH